MKNNQELAVLQQSELRLINGGAYNPPGDDASGAEKVGYEVGYYLGQAVKAFMFVRFFF